MATKSGSTRPTLQQQQAPVTASAGHRYWRQSRLPVPASVVANRTRAAVTATASKEPQPPIRTAATGQKQQSKQLIQAPNRAKSSRPTENENLRLDPPSVSSPRLQLPPPSQPGKQQQQVNLNINLFADVEQIPSPARQKLSQLTDTLQVYNERASSLICGLQSIAEDLSNLSNQLESLSVDRR